MTTGELIEQLRQCPAAATPVVFDPDADVMRPIARVMVGSGYPIIELTEWEGPREIAARPAR